MKKNLICVAGLIVLTAAFASAAEKTKIAVIDFQSIGSEISKTELGMAIAENLRTALIDSDKFQVIERSSLKKIFEEQKLQYSGAIDQDTAVRMGKVAGVEKIVMGSVTKLGYNYTINVRFIDVATGVATKAKKVTGSSENHLPRMVDDIVALLTGGTPAERRSASRRSRSHRAESVSKETSEPEGFRPGFGAQFGLGFWGPALTVVKDEFDISSLAMFVLPLSVRYDMAPNFSLKGEMIIASGSSVKKKKIGFLTIEEKYTVTAIPVIFSGVLNFPLDNKLNLYVEGGLGIVFGSLKYDYWFVSQTASGVSPCISLGGGGELLVSKNIFLGANLRLIASTIKELEIESSTVDSSKVGTTWKDSKGEPLPLELSGITLNAYMRIFF